METIPSATYPRSPADDYTTNVTLDKLTELAIIATDGPQSPLLQPKKSHFGHGFSDASTSFNSSIHSYAKLPISQPLLPKTQHFNLDMNNNLLESDDHKQAKDDSFLNNNTLQNSGLWTSWDSNAALTLSSMARSHKEGSASAPTTPTKRRHKSTSLKLSTTSGICKRPMNAFMLFAKRFRLEYTQKHPGKDNRAISVILGDKWKHLCRDERQAYTLEAKEIADEYMKYNPNCWKRKRHHSASS